MFTSKNIGESDADTWNENSQSDDEGPYSNLYKKNHSLLQCGHKNNTSKPQKSRMPSIEGDWQGAIQSDSEYSDDVFVIERKKYGDDETSPTPQSVLEASLKDIKNDEYPVKELSRIFKNLPDQGQEKNTNTEEKIQNNSLILPFKKDLESHNINACTETSNALLGPSVIEVKSQFTEYINNLKEYTKKLVNLNDAEDSEVIPLLHPFKAFLDKSVSCDSINEILIESGNLIKLNFKKMFELLDLLMKERSIEGKLKEQVLILEEKFQKEKNKNSLLKEKCSILDERLKKLSANNNADLKENSLQTNLNNPNFNYSTDLKTENNKALTPSQKYAFSQIAPANNSMVCETISCAEPPALEYQSQNLMQQCGETLQKHDALTHSDKKNTAAKEVLPIEPTPILYIETKNPPKICKRGLKKLLEKSSGKNKNEMQQSYHENNHNDAHKRLQQQEHKEKEEKQIIDESPALNVYNNICHKTCQNFDEKVQRDHQETGKNPQETMISTYNEGSKVLEAKSRLVNDIPLQKLKKLMEKFENLDYQGNPKYLPEVNVESQIIIDSGLRQYEKEREICDSPKRDIPNTQQKGGRESIAVSETSSDKEFMTDISEDISDLLTWPYSNSSQASTNKGTATTATDDHIAIHINIYECDGYPDEQVLKETNKIEKSQMQEHHKTLQQLPAQKAPELKDSKLVQQLDLASRKLAPLKEIETNKSRYWKSDNKGTLKERVSDALNWSWTENKARCDNVIPETFNVGILNYTAHSIQNGEIASKDDVEAANWFYNAI